MKSIKVLLFVLITSGAYSQPLDKFIVPTLMSFVGGMADGVHQTLITRYSNFQYKHPNANPDFWNPDLSWQRKYKDWDAGDKRAAFPLAKGPFVMFTDGYHLMQGVRNLSTIGGFSYTFALMGPKKKWYQYAIVGVAQYAVNRAGFELTYNMFYRQ